VYFTPKSITVREEETREKRDDVRGARDPHPCQLLWLVWQLPLVGAGATWRLGGVLADGTMREEEGESCSLCWWRIGRDRSTPWMDYEDRWRLHAMESGEWKGSTSMGWVRSSAFPFLFPPPPSLFLPPSCCHFVASHFDMVLSILGGLEGGCLPYLALPPKEPCC